MKLISTVRASLSTIHSALQHFPPDETFRGINEGVCINPEFANQYPYNPNLEYVDATDDRDANPEEDEIDVVVPELDPYFEIGSDSDETFPSLDGAEGEHIRQSVLLKGMDALGYYVSFHYTGVQWGIYIPVSGLAYLVKEAFYSLPVPISNKIHLAFHAILNHELMHFAVDYAVSQEEVIFQEPWYVPAKKIFKSAPPSYCILEETMANAYMLKAFRTMKPSLRLRGKVKALRDFTKLQPIGYRDAIFAPPSKWESLLPRLAHEYGRHGFKSALRPDLWDRSSGYDWPAQFPIKPRIDWRYCPIHLVNDGARLGIPPDWLSFFSRLQNIKESDQFIDALVRLAHPIQQAWERTKRKLDVALTHGLDFKKWPKGKNIYSVRVNDNYRAHLQFQPPSEWLAIMIGTHNEMGHG
jgi:hypothetical protein